MCYDSADGKGNPATETTGMRIYTCYTPSHDALFRGYFMSSLPASLDCRPARIDTQGAGDFLSADFLQCILAKLQLVIASLAAHPGEVIVWCDVDVVFLADPAPALAALVESQPDVELWFQRESSSSPEVNVGFVVMRCTASVVRFYERALQRMQEQTGWNDQRAINELLQHERLVRWNYLPMTFAARSHGWPPAAGCLVYHANCTAGPNGVAMKIAQFVELNRILSAPRPQPARRAMQALWGWLRVARARVAQEP